MSKTSKKDRVVTLLHRDDPDKAPLGGNVKVTREDWLNVAMDLLVSDGVGEVKVLAIGDRLGVSRSSFYWYFKSRQDLLDGLLERWRATNTVALIRHSELPSKSINEAVCNVFRCFVDPDRFNNALDFAIRDWARRSGKVNKVLDRSEQARLAAMEAMFTRFGYEKYDALTRGRTLYFMQIGYNLADLGETIEERLKLVPYYLYGFTGIEPDSAEVEAFSAHVRDVTNRITS